MIADRVNPLRLVVRFFSQFRLIKDLDNKDDVMKIGRQVLKVLIFFFTLELFIEVLRSDRQTLVCVGV